MLVALASARPYDATDTDLPLLIDAFDRRGHEAVIRHWDDRSVDWDRHDVTLIRSCWDYVHRREEFLSWARTVPRLVNDAEVLAWNTDKTYLRDLADGVPTVPTVWDLADESALPPAGQWVVKPTVSAGSDDTLRSSDAADAARHSRALRDAGRSSMTQPYIDSVDAQGETALVYLAGEFSHAMVKNALLRPNVLGRSVTQQITPVTPSADQRGAAEHVLAVCARRGVEPVYARIDLVEDDSGAQLLLELEATEPSLFLRHAEGGADRVAEAVLRHAAGC